MAEKLPTIIDNRGDNTLLHALQRLLPGVQGLDITTGLFEIGSFLLLEQLWQGLDKIRILMGDETTKRTKKEIVESLRKKSDASIEGEKEHQSKDILGRVYECFLSHFAIAKGKKVGNFIRLVALSAFRSRHALSSKRVFAAESCLRPQGQLHCPYV